MMWLALLKPWIERVEIDVVAYFGIAPSQPERSFVSKELSESQHHSVDKREEQVDDGAAE